MEELQAWIAEVLDSQARWRSSKAEAYPGDPRNVRSAKALADAAEYVRNLKGPNESAGLRAFASFVDALEHEGGGVPGGGGGRYATEPEAVVSAGRRTGRFGFDGALDYEDALRRLLDDSIESWAEALADSTDAPPTGLVVWFEEAGFRIWEEGEEE